MPKNRGQRVDNRLE